MSLLNVFINYHLKSKQIFQLANVTFSERMEPSSTAIAIPVSAHVFQMCQVFVAMSARRIIGRLLVERVVRRVTATRSVQEVSSVIR